MDDDNYVNVRTLVKLLSSYPHTQDIYIGKPSLDRPIQATERISENKMVRWRRGGREVGAGLIWAGICSPVGGRRSHGHCFPLSRSTLCISGLPRAERGFVSAGGWH